MAETNVVKRTYPWQTNVSGVDVTLRLMKASDRDDIVAFVRTLPEHDLLFLRTDVTDPKVVDEWLKKIEEGRTVSLVAESEDGILGYASLHRDDGVSWTRHVGEIRVMLKPDLRGFGLGKILANEVFAIAKDLGLQKIMVRMTTDQRGARGMVEALGFRPEALLADYAMGRDGQTYDLLIMTYDVTGFSDTAETRPRR